MVGLTEIPKGDLEICLLLLLVISLRAGLLLSGWLGNQSMISSDSFLIFLTWLWTGTPISLFLLLLISLFSISFFWLLTDAHKVFDQKPKILWLCFSSVVACGCVYIYRRRGGKSDREREFNFGTQVREERIEKFGGKHPPGISFRRLIWTGFEDFLYFIFIMTGTVLLMVAEIRLPKY